MFYDIIVTNKKVLRFIKTFTMVSNKFRSLKKHIAKDVFENSLTFEELEDILSKLPSNIYLKVAVGKYIFATHYWHHLDHGNNENWTICGKTDYEIRKNKENALLSMEKDKEIIAKRTESISTNR